MKNFFWIPLLVFSIGVGSCERASTEWPDPTTDVSPLSGCKGFDLKDGGIASNQDCLKFEYLNDSILSFTHLNAGFNCCPRKVDVSAKFHGDTLLITETEIDALCDCNCLYDLVFSINNIPLGKFIISVEEPYARRPDDAPLIFEVDLEKTKSGQICVLREYYPWGL